MKKSFVKMHKIARAIKGCEIVNFLTISQDCNFVKLLTILCGGGGVGGRVIEDCESFNNLFAV